MSRNVLTTFEGPQDQQVLDSIRYRWAEIDLMLDPVSPCGGQGLASVARNFQHFGNVDFPASLNIQ